MNKWMNKYQTDETGLVPHRWDAVRADLPNNREAGDLTRHRAHYDVIVMYWSMTLGNVPVMIPETVMVTTKHWQMMRTKQ